MNIKIISTLLIINIVVWSATLKILLFTNNFYYYILIFLLCLLENFFFITNMVINSVFQEMVKNK